MLTTMFLCGVTIQKSTHTHRALEHFKLSYDCNITRFIVSSRIPSIYTGCKYRRNRSSAVYLHVNSPCLPWIESWWKTNKWHDSVTITFSIDGIHTLSSAMYTHNRVNCEWCALFWFRVAKHSYSWTWMNVTSATWQTQKSIRLNFLLNVGSKQLRWHSFCSCSIFFFVSSFFLWNISALHEIARKQRQWDCGTCLHAIGDEQQTV